MENGNGQNEAIAQGNVRSELPEALKLGELLRTTRESKGLSLIQITEQLDIRSYLLNDMEKGRFAHLRLGDCLAYAKLIGVNGDLVKSVHALSVKKKAEDGNSSSKLKLYVGIAVMAAGVLILCLLLGRSGSEPSGEGLIDVSQSNVKDNNLKLQEETVTQLENTDNADGEIGLGEESVSRSGNISDSADASAADGIVLEETQNAVDSNSQNTNQDMADNTAANNNGGVTVLVPNTNASATEPSTSRTDSQAKDETLGASVNAKAEKAESVKESTKTENNSAVNDTRSHAPAVAPVAQKPAAKTTIKPASKPVAAKITPKTTAKPVAKAADKSAAKPASKLGSKTAATNSSKSSAKPLAYGEVRSLADELGIKQSSKAPQTNKSTAPAASKSLGSSQVKPATTQTNSVKAASSKTKGVAGPHVVSPKSSSGSSLKAGQVVPLGRE